MTTATENFMEARFRVPLTGPQPVGADGASRPRTALVSGKIFFHPRHIARQEVSEELRVGIANRPIQTGRLRRIAYLLPEEAAALEVGDFIAFPNTGSVDAKQMARALLSSPLLVSEFKPVRVEEVTDETYTHPEGRPHDSTHLKRGETYVKVYVKPAGPLKPDEAEELGGWME